jgi:excisionase family DNA binding protein
VEDFALDRPFTSSPLRHSQLVLKTHAEGEPAALDVVFANEHHHDLFLADGDNRKSLRAFLASRFGAGTVFALTYTAVTSAEASANGSSVRSIHPAESAEALNISRTKVFELLQVEALRSVKIGKSRRIPTEAVREFVACLSGE